MALALGFPVNLLAGPSYLFNFQNSLITMGFGQIFLGIVTPFILVPSLPEMIESVIHQHPEKEFLVNDLSSGIFNCFLGIGQIIAPLYGSLMTEYYGFRLTADILALMMLSYSILYFFLGDGINGFKYSRCTNYGEEVHFEPELFTALNRTRIALNASDDFYMRERLFATLSMYHELESTSKSINEC